MNKINWAILGTGAVANEMATAIRNSGKEIYAVGNRTHSKAIKFAEKYNIGKVYDDFEEMFSDPKVDVIYITTPHNTHFKYIKKALSNGKHLLTEKAITLNTKELDEALKIAKENNAILCEAMTIFHMPLYRKLKEILDSGTLGKVNSHCLQNKQSVKFSINSAFFIEMCYNKCKKIIKSNKKACT